MEVCAGAGSAIVGVALLLLPQLGREAVTGANRTPRTSDQPSGTSRRDHGAVIRASRTSGWFRPPWCAARNDQSSRGGAARGGGEPERPDRTPRKPEWDRFTITFADGGHLRLFDKRRLGRVRLEPDLSVLGPDAETIGREEFRTRVARSRAPVKARLLDQAVLAGVGNLLADEILWQTAVRPAAPADELDARTLDRLHAALGRAIASAIAHGGVHTGEVIPFRHAEASCPRCGAPMAHGTVGGRSTWWCSAEQGS